jgi:hypothetical protein
MKTRKIQMSVTQYAKQIGVTRQSILAQISKNRLPSHITANKVGSTWVLTTQIIIP